MQLTSEVTGYIGMGLTATGTALVFIPGGQVIGGGMLVLGEGMVAFGTGISAFDDYRKENWIKGTTQIGLLVTGGYIGNKLTNARSLGFQVPFKQQEINLINGLSQSFFNTANITVNKALIENQ